MALRVLGIKISVTIKHNAGPLGEVLQWLSRLLTADIFQDLGQLKLTPTDIENPWYCCPGARTLQKQAKKGSRRFPDDGAVGTADIQGGLLLAHRPDSSGSEEIKDYAEAQIDSFMGEYCRRVPDCLDFTRVVDIQEIRGFEDEDVAEFTASLRAYMTEQSGLEMSAPDLLGIRLDKSLESSVERMIIAWLVQIEEISKVGKNRYRFPD